MIVIKVLPYVLATLLVASCNSSSDQKMDPKSNGSPHLSNLIKGIVLSESVIMKQQTYQLDGTKSLSEPVITIRGENLDIDFNNALILGSNNVRSPHEFQGVGIQVEGRNITIRNLQMRGYKVGIMASDVHSLKILDSDISYHYRQRMNSIREREDLSDWLYYHENENNEWLRYGAAVYLQNCDSVLVRGLRSTQGQNGLLLVNSDDGLFYNNDIRFNSGLGIGLYRSNRNRFFHNRVDWNVRGYSHNFYQRGQDSAGFLVYEQSNDNEFAYNSATHSGDGFFLWAGNTTMNSGDGGCNGNLIYKNDFSHAPTNGIEVTFSSNRIIGNKMHECRYGIWGGYSWQTGIQDNDIQNCEVGIAIEHGQDNTIVRNEIRDCDIGLQIWERSSQPSDWGYSEAKDIRSRDYMIAANQITRMNTVLDIRNTLNATIENNLIIRFEKLIKDFTGNDDFIFDKNNVDHGRDWSKLRPLLGQNQKIETLDVPSLVTNLPSRLAEGMDTQIPDTIPRGRQFIMVNEWGPYNFEYPLIWLDQIEDSLYSFTMWGPEGAWRIHQSEGFERFSAESGHPGNILTAVADYSTSHRNIELIFEGESFKTQFGENIPKESSYPFSFHRFESPVLWTVKFFNYTSVQDPLNNFAAFEKIFSETPDHTEKTHDLAYKWWNEPTEGVNADGFATLTEGQGDFESGQYIIQLTSDDGVKLYLDDIEIFERWDIHVPTTDEIEVTLSGSHRFKIVHFEGGGLGNLVFTIFPKANQSSE